MSIVHVQYVKLATNHTGSLPPQPPLSPAKQKSTVLTNPVSPRDFLNHVAVRILDKWMVFGIQLEIPAPELKTYPADDPEQCFTRLFFSWKKKASPELSWETVIGVLESPIINQIRLALEIKEKMPPTTS